MSMFIRRTVVSSSIFLEPGTLVLASAFATRARSAGSSAFQAASSLATESLWRPLLFILKSYHSGNGLWRVLRTARTVVCNDIEGTMNSDDLSRTTEKQARLCKKLHLPQSCFQSTIPRDARRPAVATSLARSFALAEKSDLSTGASCALTTRE
jgi:hypothetical protein